MYYKQWLLWGSPILIDSQSSQEHAGLRRSVQQSKFSLTNVTLETKSNQTDVSRSVFSQP